MANSTTWAARNVTFEDFDPNKQFSDKPLYGFFDGYRFRTFAQRGHMLNAVHAATNAKCYIQTPGGWQLIALKSSKLRGDSCDLCGTGIKASFTSSYYYPEHKSWVFRRDQSGKIAEPLELLHVCKNCGEYL